jgi:hypothetical protein
MEGQSTEQHPILFSPSDSLTSTQQQPLTIHIAQQTRILFVFIFIIEFFLLLANSNMSDMSSPNHALDSPMSDDYSTASTGVLDTHSLSGNGSGDALTSHFKSKEIFFWLKYILQFFYTN